MRAHSLSAYAFAFILILLAAASQASAQSSDKQICGDRTRDGAAAACTRIIDNSKMSVEDRAIAYRLRGDVHRLKRDLDKAIADYTQSIALSRGDRKRAIAVNSNNLTRALNGRGYTYIQQANFRIKDERDRDLLNAAVKDFDEALAVDPKNTSALGNRADAHRILGNSEQSLRDIEQSLQINPKNGAGYYARATYWRSLGEIDLAIADFSKAIELNGNLELSLSARAALYERKNDLARAKADYEAALAAPLRHDFGARAKETARKRLAAIAEMEQEAAKPALPGSGRRVALVIGNSAYASFAPLANPKRDAETIAATLRKVGFQTVTLQHDLSREKLLNALRTFAGEAEKADWAIVYFAGHGIEIAGTNYLVPVDAKLESDRAASFEAIPLDQVITAVEGAKRLRLVLLDACRDNPFARQMKRSISTRSLAGGLAAIEPEAGTMVVYAAKHGQYALDGEGANSPFVSALVKNMTVPNLEIRKMFDLVRDDVMDMTKRKQQPFSYGSISGRQDFFFVAK